MFGGLLYNDTARRGGDDVSTLLLDMVDWMEEGKDGVAVAADKIFGSVNPATISLIK